MKEIAKSLVDIFEDDSYAKIQDQKYPCENIAEEVLSTWNYDLYSRKPGPAYTQLGIFQGTDLDLACFLSELSQRGAVINIPTYTGVKPKSIKTGQIITSPENRHGKIISVVSNKDTFSFSIRILDANVITSDEVGDFRNFSITNPEGSLYDGWKYIQFLPNQEENKFITENKLWSGNKIIFKHFIAPGRWTSFYGRPYFLLKCLERRLVNEQSHCTNEISRLYSLGLRLPESERTEWPKQFRQKGQSMKIDCFESTIMLPEPKNTFPIYRENIEDLKVLFNLRRKIKNKLLPRIRFHTRCTELAFYKYGISHMANGSYMERVPTWIKKAEWIRDFKFTGTRKKWNRLIYFQPEVGKYGVSLLYRIYKKSIIVNESFEKRNNTDKGISDHVE